MVMRGAVIEKLFTSSAGWFDGCSSSSSCSSPTSPLDLKLVMSPRRGVHNSSCDEVAPGRGIGLGIIVNMDKSCESKAILVWQSHHVNANIDDEEEENTIVTRHHKPNDNNNSYAKKLVYDNCGDHGKLIRSLFGISPTPTRVVDDIKAAGAHFLSTCHGCNKQLHGKDIYMYRGEKAFCSIECRSMEIAQIEKEESMKKKMMKRNKHDCGSSTSYAPQQVPVSRSSGHGHCQMMSTGIFAI